MVCCGMCGVRCVVVRWYVYRVLCAVRRVVYVWCVACRVVWGMSGAMRCVLRDVLYACCVWCVA